MTFRTLALAGLLLLFGCATLAAARQENRGEGASARRRQSRAGGNQQVSLDAVPPPVKSAFEARGKVLLAETVTKDGRVTYEAQVRQKNGKRTEVVVNAEGKPVKF